MNTPLDNIDDAATSDLPWEVAKTLSSIPFRQALYRIRFAELALMRDWIKPQDSVLEIGGSTGFQSHFLRRWCREVVAIDIASREKSESFAPVIEYDGSHIPFPDQSFDVVCSSLTLPMLEDREALPRLIREMQRVLKDDGVTVHLVPTPMWSVWSALFHPVVMLERAFRRVIGRSKIASKASFTSSGSSARNERGSRWSVGILFRPPIGERRSVLHELLSYRRNAWIHAFETQGFEVIAFDPGRLFYTGQLRFGMLPMVVRRGLSHLLGSSTCVLAAKKRRAAGVQRSVEREIGATEQMLERAS
ncbi:MAG: class I SAM-dependent methyltransferase [Bdellovibrionota bacterium]|nr:MAG: class I SAM-dependent methyltransferase [Bdellovibrionota bacterium]